jgi:hypothetical protein
MERLLLVECEHDFILKILSRLRAAFLLSLKIKKAIPKME